MRWFPGRTLDELDGMDWGRFLRAHEAQMRIDAESVRRAHLAGQMDAKAIPAETWALIAEHEQMMMESPPDGLT